MLLFQASRVAWIFRGIAPAFEIAKGRTPSGVAKSGDDRIGMFRRMMDLTDIHNGRHARIDLGEATEQFGNIDILRSVEDREFLQDPLIIIGGTLRPPIIDED